MALSRKALGDTVLAVTFTFEKKSRSFERLLPAPIPLELLGLAKTSGAILFGVASAFVPVGMAAFLVDLSCGLFFPSRSCARSCRLWPMSYR